jgi:hypothetical protein
LKYASKDLEKIKIRIIVSIIIFISISAFCFSDTLYLKDGRSITSETVWKEDGYYMYTAYGATIGISKENVERVEYSKEKRSSFQFDIWPFGITVDEVIDIAQRNDVPIHRAGIISMNKHFHPMVRRHASSNHFIYNTTLLGHFSKVELFFTPISKRLHTVSIQWPNQKTKDTRLTNEIIHMISEKYDQTHGEQKKLFYSSLDWTAEDNNQIEMIVRSTSILLNYLHTDLRQQDYEEQENLKSMKIKTGAKKDKEKF